MRKYQAILFLVLVQKCKIVGLWYFLLKFSENVKDGEKFEIREKKLFFSIQSLGVSVVRMESNYVPVTREIADVDADDGSVYEDGCDS